MQNKKKIIISSYDDIKNPHYGGGGAIAIHEIAKRLVKDYDISVLSWDYNGKKQEQIDGVHYERFGFSNFSPKIGMFLFQLGLPFQIKKRNFDLWFESFCPPFTTAMLPRYTRKPVTGIVHMLAAEDMERKYKLPFHLIQNYGLKKYRSVITTSDGIKEKVHHIAANAALTVISNGVDKVFTPLKKKQRYFLYLGRIENDQKGLDLLIDAFQQFQTQIRGYKFIIAGSGDPTEIEKLNGLINTKGLQDTILLKGKVTGKIKENLLRNATSVVIPSRFETFSLVALEAMAHGSPVICFNIEGLSWIPQKAALKVSPFDVELLAKALITIVSDRVVSESLTKEGTTYALNYTWDNIASKYDTFIKQLLK